MLLEYRNLKANLSYCGKTKAYYGEVLNVGICIVFQASNRKDVVIAMRKAVNLYLLQLQK